MKIRKCRNFYNSLKLQAKEPDKNFLNCQNPETCCSTSEVVTTNNDFNVFDLHTMPQITYMRVLKSMGVLEEKDEGLRGIQWRVLESMRASEDYYESV